MDRLTATRVFVTVVEHGSLTQAAERLEMSTAMVTGGSSIIMRGPRSPHIQLLP